MKRVLGEVSAVELTLVQCVNDFCSDVLPHIIQTFLYFGILIL